MRSLSFFCVLFLVSVLFAIPGQINYQGKLTDASGVAIDGTHNLTFALYDAETDGTLFWQESHSSVSVNKGLFDVILGESNPLPDTLDFSAQYWLQITVDGEDLSPRIPLTSVPYAFRASIADSAANIDLDTLQAYLDTTNHFATLDTIGAYSDTNHTHNLTLTGDITGSGVVSGTIATDLSDNSVDWDELATSVQDSIVGNWVRLSPNAAQTDAGATPSIYINKTGVGELLLLQNSGTDRVKISNSGNDFSLLGPGGTKSIISDSALAISANKGAIFTIDADSTSGNVSLRILHDSGDTLFWISEANYVGIKPRTTEPSSTPRGGLYVNGNATGTDTLYFYDGSDWEPIYTQAMLGGNFIFNQYSSEQSADFLISGKGNVHNTADSDTAFIAREGGANGIGGYFRGGSSSDAVALVAERPTENNLAELGTADYGVYGEVDGSDESGVMGHNIASSGTDSAKGILGVADGAGGSIHIGVRGNASGATTNYGGFFSPMLGLSPQSSVPAGANGGLYVKNGSPDSIFFYDGSAWTPIKTGSENTQWEQTGSSPSRYKRPLFDGAGNDNVRVFETDALKGVYGRSYQDASNYALGYLGYYGNDIGETNRFIGVYGNSGSGTDNLAVAGRYDANNYGYIGGNGIGVAGYGTTYGVYGRYNSTTYGFIGGQVSGDDIAIRGNGTWASGFFGDYNDSDCGERGIYAIGTIYGVFARDTTGGTTSADNFAYLGYRDPNSPNYRYGIYASGLDYAGYFLGNVKIDASTGNDARQYINRPSTNEEASIRFQTAGSDDWFLGLDDPATGYNNFQLYNYDAGGYVVTVENGTGNVGIGTTSPGYKLHIQNTGGASSAKIGYSSSYTDNRLFFGDANYVYVGELNADDRLYLRGSSISIDIGGNLGSSGQVLKSNGTTLYWADDETGGGGGTPGGYDGTIQFNNSGSFGGDSALVWDRGDSTLIIKAASVGDGLRIEGDTYGCPVIVLKNTNTYGSMAYGFGTSGDTYYAGVEFEIDSSGTEVNKMILYNNNPGAIEFAINPGGGTQTLMRMPPDASRVSMLKPLSLDYSRTYVSGYDGGGNHWVTTGGPESGSCFMSFIGTGGGNATAVNIAPGGGTGLYVNSSHDVGIGTSSPTSKLHVVGNIYCTGKITSDGGYDPPYVLYDSETREAIKARIVKEVPKEKLTGAVLFWNGESKRFEVYLPTEGEFLDLQGNLLLKEEPLQLK